ncbi:MAG: peptidyl-prolyl cis-trans isomerase [Acidithiobacillales bacterium]
MRSLLREPLVHFLLLGGLMFLWFEWRGGSGGPGGTRIVVTPGQIQHLASGFARTWQRPPTEVELKGLVDDYVKEEIAVREAAVMGLDRDDTIIRRRLRQKLEFLVEETAGQVLPTDAEVRAWVDTHPGSFGEEPRVSLRQVFVSPQRRGAGARAEAGKLLMRLRAAGPGAATGDLGDPTMLPPELPLGPLGEASRTFGEDFARAVAGLEPGTWAGPVGSTYGLHLVLVRQRVAASQPDLATIRPMVERELLAERSKKELSALYERMLKKYTVAIEMPRPAEAKAAAGSVQ